MPRHIVSKAGKQTAAQMMDDWCGPTPKKRSPGAAGTARKRHIADVKERWPRKDWEGLTADRLVALYWVCHEQTYGMVPVELDKPKAWAGAMSAAKRMVREHFNDDMGKAISFMRWVWNRERGREDWRRQNNRQGRRITWRHMFIYDDMITDWRAAQMRAR